MPANGVEVAIRVGVNTGEVVRASWDASGEQQKAVTGDTVNTAARIQAAADPGRVLVGEETRHLTRRLISYLKGKAEQVHPGYASMPPGRQVVRVTFSLNSFRVTYSLNYHTAEIISLTW